MTVIVCRPRSLPLDKLATATRRALEINPDNARERRSVVRTPIGRRGGPRRIAVVTARRWPASGVRLSVSFLDNPSRELRSRILLHMNAWGEAANVAFTETAGIGEVRIARFDEPDEVAGYWSWVGTEIFEIDVDQPTMNLDSFTARTSEATFRRVVRHEAGHTLGFDHEHMRSDIVRRIDRKKAIAYYDETEGWTEKEVSEQVLTPLSKKSIMGTVESDPLSIMCYQLPAEIMKDGKAVEGGVDINPKDFAFAASLYPKEPARVPAGPTRPEPVVMPERPATPAEEVDTFHVIVMAEFRPEASADEVNRPTPKFAQVLASYGGARVTSAMQLRADKGQPPTRFGRIIGMHERIRKYTNRERGTLPNDEQMMAFGSELFETLFQGDVRRLYDEARSRQQRQRLDLVLTSMIPWISDKPWEFAYDAGRKTFLATEEIHFVRNVLTNVPADPIVQPQGPLRILVAAAQPVGMGRLSIEQEIAVIERGFAPLIEGDLIALEVRAGINPDQLHDELSSGHYQIVHFIGHGVYDDKRREGCLVFENNRGGAYMLGERSLRELFCKRGLSLVFLNACESGRGGRAEFNKGVAQSLVAHGLPALVANQYSVLDSSATSFARRFYWSLAHGLSVGQAAREARIAVNYSLNGEPIDWAVPVLYARDPCLTLCAAPATRTPLRRMTAAAEQRTRALSRRQHHIAVWDVDDVFPALERTLDAMNAAQTVFGFELADVSAPLDVWDVNAEEGRSYLRAERVAERLKDKAAELGADVLACVTSHWIRDEEWLNLYGWWPDAGKPPVAIFSVAGFDQLQPEGHETDRALANAMVTLLAGLYGQIGTHDTGAPDCPMAFNEERDFEHVAGPQRFDAKCRAHLRARLGPALDALEELLAIFDQET